jgi:ribosomal subunit interface protein
MVRPLEFGRWIWQRYGALPEHPRYRQMQLLINGKQLDIGGSLRQHIEREVPAVVEKYFDKATEASVTVSKEGNDFRTDIAVHIGKGMLVQGHSVSGDPYGSFDDAAEHVGKRLRRYKRRLRNHHRADTAKEDFLRASQYVLAAEEEAAGADEADEDGLERDQPVIIAEMETRIETLTVGEAVMRMDLANLPAMMFRNRSHGGLNMVYLRGDGNIGWIDPEHSRT